MTLATLRSFALAAFATAGLFILPGCNTENPDGSPNALGKAEAKARELEKKAEEGAKKAEAKIEEGAKKAGQAVGKAMEEGGKKLQEVSKPGEAPKEAPKN